MRRRVLAGLVAAALLLGGCGGGSGGSGGGPSRGTSVSSQAAVPAGREVVIALPLAVRAPALAAAADASAEPGPGSGHFRSVASIAAEFGAPSSVMATDRRRLRELGLNLRVDPSHGAFWGTVTAAQARRYFGTELVRVGADVAPAGTPHVPPGLVGVTGVVGLSAGSSTATRPTGLAISTGCPPDLMTEATLARLFGFSNLLRAGHQGAGTTVDILAVHDWQPAVFAQYAHCGSLHAAAPINQDRVPLTPRTGGGPEIALDALVLTLLAPRAHLGVTHYDSVTAIAFPLMKLLSHPKGSPDVLDITVDYCESDLTGPELKLSEWLLAVLAASGTTTVAAAGDYGSSGCHPGPNSPSATYPASSRFVTSVGGLDFGGGAEAPQDLRPWNEPGVAGGGGGTSARVAAPAWQPGSRRQVPDVAAFAAPAGAGAIPVCLDAESCAWSEQGGTSLAATALSAVAVLSMGGHGGTVRRGNLAPLLWATAAHADALRDVTHGANTTFTTSCCQAKPGYDTASGWGLFVPDRLARYYSSSSGG